MFSILVVFLLMNFSTSGELFFDPSNEVKMPRALHGRPLEAGPVVSISAAGRVTFDSEREGEKEHLEDNQEGLPRLRAKLQQLRIIEQTARPNVPFKGQVHIRADQNTKLDQIKRVITAVTEEQWTGINFAVTPTDNTRTPTSE